MEMEFINYLPNMADMASLFSILGAVICASGALGVLYGKVERNNHEISALLLTMVAGLPVEEAFDPRPVDVNPEILFFGELLPEESALPLPVMDERLAGAVESWSCDHDGLTAAIYRVAGVNRAGRIINPSNGRFIPSRELSLWFLPADLARLAV